jgi:hypothetical protein
MTDDPTTPEEIVTHARLIAQRQGKVLLAEMIAHLDEVVSDRCAGLRAWTKMWTTEGFDLETWGRRTHVLESALSFLQRIDSDEEARDYLARRFRREVIRGGKGTSAQRVDAEDGRQAAGAGGDGDSDLRDR